MEGIFDLISVNFVSFGAKVLLALVVFFIGKIVIGKIVHGIDRAFEKKALDPMIRTFAHSCINALCYVILFIATISVLGIEMTSLVAILGAATLAIGLALQGSLANFAGGFLIVLFKPFEVGDFVEAGGHTGTVDAVQIFYTVINTVDNRKIIIPNGQLSNNSIVNYTRNNKRRVDIDFGIGYGNDYKKAIDLLKGIANSQDKVLKDPGIQIRLKEFGDSSVNITYRVWAETANYWDVYFDSMEMAKDIFDKEGIEIPYPQLDVHFNPKSLEGSKD